MVICFEVIKFFNILLGFIEGNWLIFFINSSWVLGEIVLRREWVRNKFNIEDLFIIIVLKGKGLFLLCLKFMLLGLNFSKWCNVFVFNFVIFFNFWVVLFVGVVKLIFLFIVF